MVKSGRLHRNASRQSSAATPNHPSYPAAHARRSQSPKCSVYLFPRDEILDALGARAAESRVWAGIHFRSEIVAGRELALAIAKRVIDRAAHDGAEP